jgi:hypothetical protein
MMNRFLIGVTKMLAIVIIVPMFFSDFYIAMLSAAKVSQFMTFGLVFLSMCHAISVAFLIVAILGLKERIINRSTGFYLFFGFINSQIAYSVNQDVKEIAIFTVACHVISALLIKLAFLLEKRESKFLVTRLMNANPMKHNERSLD